MNAIVDTLNNHPSVSKRERIVALMMTAAMLALSDEVNEATFAQAARVAMATTRAKLVSGPAS